MNRTRTRFFSDSDLEKVTVKALEFARQEWRYKVIGDALTKLGFKTLRNRPIDEHVVSEVLLAAGYRRGARTSRAKRALEDRPLGVQEQLNLTDNQMDRQLYTHINSRLKAVKTILMIQDIQADERITHALLLLEHT